MERQVVLGLMMAKLKLPPGEGGSAIQSKRVERVILTFQNTSFGPTTDWNNEWPSY